MVGDVALATDVMSEAVLPDGETKNMVWALELRHADARDAPHRASAVRPGPQAATNGSAATTPTLRSGHGPAHN